MRNRDQGGPKAVGAAIRSYALELARDKTTTFAQNIENFIACTCESKEVNPQVSDFKIKSHILLAVSLFSITLANKIEPKLVNCAI